MDTEAKLKEVEVKLEQNAADMRAIEGAAAVIGLEITNLKATLAEEQKPKLRHGDYGYSDRNNGNFLVLENNDDGLCYWDKGFGLGAQIDTSDGRKHFVKSGNIFDDLKAMSEELEEFTVEDSIGTSEFKANISGGRIDIYMTHGSCCMGSFPLDSAHEIAMKILAIEATARKKA